MLSYGALPSTDNGKKREEIKGDKHPTSQNILNKPSLKWISNQGVFCTHVHTLVRAHTHTEICSGDKKGSGLDCEKEFSTDS